LILALLSMPYTVSSHYMSMRQVLSSLRILWKLRACSDDTYRRLQVQFSLELEQLYQVF